MRTNITAMTFFVVLAGAALANAASSTDYVVENSIHLEGDMGWDLLTVDDSSSRLFLSHGDRVDVVDLTMGKAVGIVSGLKGAHAIATVPSANKGYATSGKDSTVVIFDLKTYATIARIPAGGVKPDAILFEPVSKRVFVGLAGSNALSAIDVDSSKVVGTVALQGNPELMAVDGNGLLYVAIEDKSQVVAIDARTLKVTATWALKPGVEPTGLALDPVTHRLFAGCSNHLLMILDANTGKVVDQIRIGDHIDGVAFDPVLKRVYSSGGDGTLTVVQEESADKFRLLEVVTTKRGARTLALDRKSLHVYLPTADYGPVPPATTDEPKPRPAVLPGTFTVLDVFPIVLKNPKAPSLAPPAARVNP